MCWARLCHPGAPKSVPLQPGLRVAAETCVDLIITSIYTCKSISEAIPLSVLDLGWVGGSSARAGPAQHRLCFCFHRADWFLLDSRTVRHAAIGLFCCGVSVYLTALAIYMLLLFELEAGIASACILSSGIIVLLITVTHALVRASQVSHRSRSEVSHTLYENDSAQHGESSASDLNNKNAAEPRPRPQIHREFSFPPFLEHKSQLGSPASSNLTSSGSPGLRSEQESYNLPRTHRTLSAESGLLQAQSKPWHGVTQEMRNVLSRKPGPSGKDSTLV
ncbi:transmembrane protein 221 [Athene cunicularia]|uniref:transmembrane protein 221 n=1 Tax=Athene cunicularia TaxID=194338 RepID=UPI000EF6530D|nr:transmembrane protein 221 [Athene cunicularia]